MSAEFVHVCGFIPGDPPRVTAQMRKVAVVHGKPVFYDTPAIKDAKRYFMRELKERAPEQPCTRAVRLEVCWMFPTKNKSKDGAYKTTRPDTDNLMKIFKDCMTKAGFWKDDAQVVYEQSEKIWSTTPGIEFEVLEIL